MAYHTELSIEQAMTELAFLGQLSWRPTFGNYGIYCRNTAFALLAEGKLYLRTNRHFAELFIINEMEPFIYKNRGVPVQLHYYHVHQQLWEKQHIFKQLVEQALLIAIDDKIKKHDKDLYRLKRLPNITVSLERLLWRIGIISPEELTKTGAVRTYILIKKASKHASIDILYALAGALEGCHAAALTETYRMTLRQELQKEQLT